MPGKPKREQRTIIFVSYESEYAKSGGLGAVMSILPKQMALHEKDCLVMAPLFKKITNLERLLENKKIKGFKTCAQFDLMIGEKGYIVDIIEVIGPEGFRTYLLSSNDFFNAPADPFMNPVNAEKPMNPYTNPVNPVKLAEDALFFCAAIPKALIELGKTQDIVLHLQDWEAACTAKAVKMDPAFSSAACILTLHNPYDRHLGNMGFGLVAELTNHLGMNYDNILSQMIPLVDGPISTVSQNFADELISSPLHTKVFAKHLQGLFEHKGMIGIDNGIFGEKRFPFPENALAKARQGDFEEIRKEKLKRRKELAKVLKSYQQRLNTLSKETWGDDLDLNDPDIPVFLVLGRDDPRQKGFDVVASAIDLIPKGKARYIFTPMPGDEGFIGLDFLRKLANDRKGEVKVFPLRLDPEPFRALQKGSSYMVMCSLYEPFGAATEAYIAGMPVVARATGGLVQQVIPYPSAALSRQGYSMSTMFHCRGNEPTGFLFREPELSNEVYGWQRIVDCNYWNTNPKGDRQRDRKGTALFDSIVQRSAWALQEAIDLYRTNQQDYSRMIYHGFNMLDNFSWDRSVRNYQRLYDLVCK